MPPKASTGPKVLAVGRRSSIDGHYIQDGVCWINTGPQGQHVFLPDARTDGGRKAITEGTLIEQLVDAYNIRPSIFFKSNLKCRQGEGVGLAAKDARPKVASPQIGAQQILAVEAGVERQLQVVVEGGAIGQGNG